MAFRRRRRFNGQWFPTQTNTGDTLLLDQAEPGTHKLSVFQVLLGSEAINALTTGLSLSTAGGLALATHHSYLIKRIVGQIFVGVQSVAGTPDTAIVNVGAGLFVERGDVGGTTLVAGAYDVKWDPLNFANSYASRFLWTRSWLLSPGGDPVEGFSQWPQTNAEYGDIRSGCHVDCKSKARIDYTSNLFLIYSAYIAGLDGPSEGNLTVDIANNLRVFGKATQYSNR